MKCPFCSGESIKVLDKRATVENQIRRRRECLNCEKRFTTYESIADRTIVIIKSDGKKEKFDRNKLLKGLYKACEKRPVSMQKINYVVDEVEKYLKNYKSEEVETKIIGDLVMKLLKNLDNVAYLRFASVYRNFEEVQHFQEEIEGLKGGK